MTSLLEHEAKALLQQYSIPVTTPRLAKSPEEAEALIQELGGVGVLKIASTAIAHKARIGGVRLGVTREQARETYRDINAAGHKVAGGNIAGVLVEPLVPPGIEIIVGALTDPIFGPVVMIGSGGGEVEAKSDVKFALAPITEEIVRGMVEPLIKQLSLSEGAGKRLCSIVMSVGGIDGLLLKEGICELDINPIIVTGETVTAVDAYIVRGGAESCNRYNAPTQEERSELFRQLQPAFLPKGIVVIGASTKPGKLGFNIIKNLIDYGFAGPVYGIHPTANNIYGCASYPSISAIPEGIDRAIVVVPASEVASALNECAHKGITVAQVYSAGFGEWSDDGKSLESEIHDVVRASGLRVIGPNTIGTFSSLGRLTFAAPRYSPRGGLGKIAFVAQSGTYALDVVSRSKVYGLPLAISLSCGNCTDLGPVDYLSYLAEDESVEIIAMYLESVEDSGRFFRLGRAIDKPLVLLRGGRTAEGARAANSHTGALASDHRLWRDAAHQAGAFLVNTIDEMMDVLLALCAHTRPILGRRLGFFTSGGGISVAASDTAAAAGMHIPELSGETRSALTRYCVPGTSVANPIDIPVWGLKSGSKFIFDDVIDALANDHNVDSVIACIEMGSVFSFANDETTGLEQLELITESIARTRAIKPVSTIFRTTGDQVQDDYVRYVRPHLSKHRIAVFPTVERAIGVHACIGTASTYRSPNWCPR